MKTPFGDTFVLQREGVWDSESVTGFFSVIYRGATKFTIVAGIPDFGLDSGTDDLLSVSAFEQSDPTTLAKVEYQSRDDGATWVKQ